MLFCLWKRLQTSKSGCYFCNESKGKNLMVRHETDIMPYIAIYCPICGQKLKGVNKRCT